MEWLKNKIQLITYPDSLWNNLKDLYYVLDTYFDEIVYWVHILPFYPSSSDRWYSPLTHLEVDPDFWNRNDIKKISRRFDLIVDFIANHISSQSDYFKDYIEKWDESLYKDMFLKFEDVFPKWFTKKDFNKIYRPRPNLPYAEYEFADWTRKKLWHTFSIDQMDLNRNKAITKRIMKSFIKKLENINAKIIRLDAAWYIYKKRWTNCFYLPEVYETINWMWRLFKKWHNVKLLSEVHNTYKLQIDISKKMEMVYDFALPPLVLYSIYFWSSYKLKRWLRMRPKNALTVLDTHDWIWIVDVAWILSKNEVENLTFEMFKTGWRAAMMASGENSNNLDIYQVNSTYYSVLDCDDNKYLISRAIQFFVPWIPQVYYVWLLAWENDMELLTKTRIWRDVNRHNYSISEIAEQLEREVVKKLFKLIKFRNKYPAFNWDFKLYVTDNSSLKMSWKKYEYYTELFVDFVNMKMEISFTEKINKKIQKRFLEI